MFHCDSVMGSVVFVTYSHPGEFILEGSYGIIGNSSLLAGNITHML